MNILISMKKDSSAIKENLDKLFTTPMIFIKILLMKFKNQLV